MLSLLFHGAFLSGVGFDWFTRPGVLGGSRKVI